MNFAALPSFPGAGHHLSTVRRRVYGDNGLSRGEDRYSDKEYLWIQSLLHKYLPPHCCKHFLNSFWLTLYVHLCFHFVSVSHFVGWIWLRFLIPALQTGWLGESWKRRSCTLCWNLHSCCFLWNCRCTCSRWNDWRPFFYASWIHSGLTLPFVFCPFSFNICF